MPKIYNPLYLLLIIGALLRIYAYSCNPSLWLDELLISNNLIEKDYAALAGNLHNGQNAPILWLWTQRFLINTLGSSEYTLRLIPLIASLLSLPLFHLLCISSLNNKNSQLYAQLVFALALPLVLYAVNVKQYATDLLFVLLLLQLGIKQVKSPTNNNLLLLTSFACLGIFSCQPFIFVLAAVGLVNFYKACKEKHQIPHWLFIGSLWLGLFAGNYFWFLRLDPTWDWSWLYEHWRAYFMPLPPYEWTDLFWLLMVLAEPLRLGLGFGPFAYAFVGLFAYGCRCAYQRDKDIFFLLFLPILFCLLGAIAQEYPFGDRLVLFLAPSSLFLTCYGLEGITKRQKWIPILATIQIVGTGLWLINGNGQYLEDSRTCLQELQQKHQGQSSVLMNYWAKHAWDYYAPRLEIEDIEVKFVQQHDPYYEHYDKAMKELLDSTTSTEVWTFYTHYVNKQNQIPLNYLSRNHVLGSISYHCQAKGASLYRYTVK